MSLFVQVFGRRHDEAIDALMRPATEKRQGTKSRWSIWWRCRERYGDLVAADIDLPRHAKNLALYCSTVEHHEIAQISSE
jgi:hypothetical protein